MQETLIESNEKNLNEIKRKIEQYKKVKKLYQEIIKNIYKLKRSIKQIENEGKGTKRDDIIVFSGTTYKIQSTIGFRACALQAMRGSWRNSKNCFDYPEEQQIKQKFIDLLEHAKKSQKEIQELYESILGDFFEQIITKQDSSRSNLLKEKIDDLDSKLIVKYKEKQQGLVEERQKNSQNLIHSFETLFKSLMAKGTKESLKKLSFFFSTHTRNKSKGKQQHD